MHPAEPSLSTIFWKKAFGVAHTEEGGRKEDGKVRASSWQDGKRQSSSTIPRSLKIAERLPVHNASASAVLVQPELQQVER